MSAMATSTSTTLWLWAQWEWRRRKICQAAWRFVFAIAYISPLLIFITHWSHKHTHAHLMMKGFGSASENKISSTRAKQTWTCSFSLATLYQKMFFFLFCFLYLTLSVLSSLRLLLNYFKFLAPNPHQAHIIFSFKYPSQPAISFTSTHFTYYWAHARIHSWPLQRQSPSWPLTCPCQQNNMNTHNQSRGKHGKPWNTWGWDIDIWISGYGYGE